ncbi:MAG: succinate dehydrogenase, cytochrome b556 subunit [Geminicoccaceae bacterium]
MASRARPLSPHLQVYRWYVVMATSILHRATGIALALGLVLLTWWLTALAGGPESFATVNGIVDSWFGGLVLFGYTAVLFYHAANGIRHMVWDVGYGYDKEVARNSGIAVVAAAGALTLLVWLIILTTG